MKAKRIVYLIHSMIYSSLAARDPRVLRDTNAGIYLERERLCERRWRAAVRQLEPDALYAQLAGGGEFLAWARQQLGEDGSSSRGRSGATARRSRSTGGS